jgi:hypothetical protein
VVWCIIGWSDASLGLLMTSVLKPWTLNKLEGEHEAFLDPELLRTRFLGLLSQSGMILLNVASP